MRSYCAGNPSNGLLASKDFALEGDLADIEPIAQEMGERTSGEGDEHAVVLGCEGIFSKRKGSRYVSGRSRDQEPGRASRAARGRGVVPVIDCSRKLTVDLAGGCS